MRSQVDDNEKIRALDFSEKPRALIREEGLRDGVARENPRTYISPSEVAARRTPMG